MPDARQHAQATSYLAACVPDALDVSTDIQVMETLLAREGLTEPEMKADPVQEDGTDIRLEL